MKTYLVTGGAGFIGSALVRRLIDGGHRVRVLDNESRGSSRRVKDFGDACEWIEADVRDAQAVRAAAAGVDAVCHLASINGTHWFYERPDLVLEVGVKGIINVLEACQACQVPELLVVSSSEVYHAAPVIPTPEAVPMVIPDPYNPRYSYAGAKIITELMALHCGRTSLRRVVVVRPHNVYGPDMGWDHVIPQLIARLHALCDQPVDPIPFPIQGTGEETRAFVYIDDCIDGIVLAMEGGAHRGIYHVGTMDEVTIAAVAQEIGRGFGRAVAVIPGRPAEGGTLRRCPDIGRLAALGYQPKVRLRDGIPMVIRWYLEHLHERPVVETVGRP